MIELSIETKKTISNLFSRMHEIESQVQFLCNGIINEKGDKSKNYNFDKDLNLIEVENKEDINAN